MGRKLRIEFENAFYHVMSRGNTRSRIFKDDKDKLRFLDILMKTHEKYGIVIHAYCLMKNHFHLLVETPNANLIKAMHKINTSYTNYYNKRHDRAGHLFSGRYKAIIVEKEKYALRLSYYIHLNPVKSKYVKEPGEYIWSSYRDYVGLSDLQPDFLFTETILSMIGKNTVLSKKRYVEGVKLNSNKWFDPQKETFAEVVLGSTDYIEWLKENSLKKGWIRSGKGLKDYKMLYGTKEIEIRIKDVINKLSNLTKREKKKFLIYFLKENTSLKLKEIGKEFDIKESAVSRAYKRFVKEVENNSKLLLKVKRIENKIFKNTYM